MSNKTRKITIEEISEMEKMLKHLHFTTNKTVPVRLVMKSLLKQYDIGNQGILGSVLSERGIVKKHGVGTKSTRYSWLSSEEPSKVMARRIIEATKKKQQHHCRVHRAKKEALKTAIKIANPEEQITREQFEKRVEKINKETGMYAEELKKIKELKGKEIKVEQPQPKHIAPIQKQETESVSLFWGLYKRTKNI